ncbi:MAG TPA: ABC transporter permease, partial [Pirellulales bacterium]|nr:ABC transporter permease [Pirellulales bacterium]
VLMIGGNLPGATRTLSIALYDQVQDFQYAQANRTALFLLAALGMGLLISIVAKNQFVAGQVAIIVTFLPAFILSGFIFDIGSMPRPIQAITHLIPARYLVSILQTVFLAGDVPGIILPNGAALLVMAAFFLGLTRWKSRKRLE